MIITKVIKKIIIIASILFISNTINSMGKIDNPLIIHSITYTHKGKRSEAKHGHLFINNKELPDVFNSVISNSRCYKFYQRKNMWGRDGYFPCKQGEQIIQEKSSREITQSELNKGYYNGKLMLKNTPSNWLYVKWEKGSAYVSSKKIFKMIKDYRLKNIQRIDLFKLQPKTKDEN